MNPASTQKKNRRRYERHFVNINACIKTPSVPLSGCEIRDLSAGGMFISLVAAQSDGKPLKILNDETVEISFDLIFHGEKNKILITALVVRVTETGIGVSFESIDPVVLDALFCMGRAKNETCDSSLPKKNQLPAAEKRLIQQSFIQEIEVSIHQIFEHFYQKIASSLQQAAETVSSDSVKQSFLDTISVLTQNRTSIEKHLYLNLADQFNQSIDELDSSDASTITELKLVDTDEFEDWLNISSVITYSNSLFEKELRQLNSKISLLVDNPVDDSTNPIAPKHICESFQEEIERFNIHYDCRKVIYQVFESALKDHLSQLYKPLIGLLANLQLEPSPINAIETTIPQAPVGQNDTSATSPYQAVQSDEIHHPSQNFSQIAHKLIELEKLDANNSRAKAQSIPTHSSLNEPNEIGHYDTEEILYALHALGKQTHPEKNSSKNIQSLELDVLDILKQGVYRTDAIDSEQINTIKVARKFYDTVESEASIDKGIQKVFDKLRLPFLQVAAEDTDFLNSQHHPAQQILNALDRISIAFNENGETSDKQLKKTLDAIIEEFDNNDSQNQDIFVDIEAKLEQFVQRFEKIRLHKIKQVQEVHQSKQTTEISKRRVENFINSRLNAAYVPKVVVSLLDAGWKHLLIVSDINEASQNVSTHKSNLVIDNLLSWLSGDPDEEFPGPEEVQEVLNFIEVELALVCTDVIQYNWIMEELTASLIGEGNPKIRKIPERVLTRNLEWVKDIGNQQQVQKPLNEWLDQVEQLKVGDWLEFYTEEEGTEPLNLVWIGNTPQNYVFVTQKGYKKCELSADKIARFFRIGSAKKIENRDIPLTTRVSNLMLQEMHDNLIQQATIDQQTGLINRKEFIKRLEYELANVKKHQSEHMLCFIEIDSFKLINNSCSLDAGEDLLKQIIREIMFHLTGEYIFSRAGDETFGILMKNTHRKDAIRIAEQMRTSISRFEFKWEDQYYPTAISLGLVDFSERTDNIINVIKQANTAYLTAKSKGRNQIQIFEEDDEQLKLQGSVFEWGGKLGKVLAENRIILRCQLIVPICPNKSLQSHYEILLMVHDEQGKTIAPDEFIPAAELCNRMTDVDKYVVKDLLDWIDKNQSIFNQIGGFAINLSGQSLNSEDFLGFLKQELTNRDIMLEKITFEITETSAISNLSFAQKFISQIQQFGCKFSLDDFGSGFSSYAYLKNLKVDYLKIDGEFVKDIEANKSDFAMVKSMNEIGHSLGMETIAEYVENEAILKKLTEIGVDYAQGFGIKKPFLLSDLGTNYA